jgi:hypothetical protein
MKPVCSVALLLVLSGLYLIVAYLVCTPKLSPEYKAYYLERTSLDWKNGPRYAAQPEQGILFGKEGLPGFVKYIYGFSGHQSWGRWTDGKFGQNAGIVLEQGLRGSVCLNVRLLPATSQLNKEITVVFGDQSKKVVFSNGEFEDYFVDFFEHNPADVIEFKLSDMPPAIPDGRRLGLGMAYLRLFRESCTTIRRRLGSGASGNPNPGCAN